MNYEMSAKEINYRIAESIFFHMAMDGHLTPKEYEVLRDRLLDIYQPIISDLERGFLFDWRTDLKPGRKDDLNG